MPVAVEKSPTAVPLFDAVVLRPIATKSVAFAFVPIAMVGARLGVVADGDSIRTNRLRTYAGGK